MTKLFKLLSLGALLLVMCSMPVMAQDVSKLDFPKLNKLNIPEVERVTLDNGMRLYLLEDKALPVFNISVRVNCGSYLEPADKVGLAGLCGQVMRTGGTQKWTGDEIDEMLEGIGASVETGIGLASGTGYINVLSEYTDLGLEALSQVMRYPAFDEDKIDLAKVQERSNISRRNDDPSTITRREFVKLIYGADSPYARHTEYETVDNITRDDLVAFHKTFYHPENVQMAIWGDFDRDEIVAKVKSFFGDWKRGNIPVPPLPKVNYNWRSKVYYIHKPDAAQSYVRVGHLGGLATDPDYTDRIVMNSIMGGGFGSRITDNVRTRLGLAYSTGGRFISNFSYPGYFFALASTKPQSTILATTEMMTQIKSMLTDPPTEEEMKKGKDGYLNSFVFNFDSRREVINRMMNYDFYGLPENFLQLEKEGVEKVTPEAVMAAARNNLRPDEMIVVVLGNADDFDAPLESLGLGPVDTVDITIPSGEKKAELAITPENIEKGMALLNMACEAGGGLDAYKGIKSVQQTGTLTLYMSGQELPISVNSVEVFPSQERMEMNIMGRTMYQIRNGDGGWKTSQMTGELVAMTPEDIADSDKEWMRNTYHIFQSLEDPFYRGVYDGEGELEGTPVTWVALVDEKDEAFCRLAFANDSHLLVGRKYWGASAMGEGELETIMSGHTEVNGLQIPMQSVTNMNGQKVLQTQASEYIINGDVPAGSFEKPEL